MLGQYNQIISLQAWVAAKATLIPEVTARWMQDKVTQLLRLLWGTV